MCWGAIADHPDGTTPGPIGSSQIIGANPIEVSDYNYDYNRDSLSNEGVHSASYIELSIDLDTVAMVDRLSFVILLLAISRVLASQPSAPLPVEAPLRNLTWGQLNFLHTTDTHGWHAGHLQE